MLSYEEMEYFKAFAEYGTLTKVADEFSISQPTITRAMKKAEEVFGIPLFDRTKNSIHLNDNGRMAAGEIAILLKQTDEMIARVQAYDRANRTISIGSAAAIQLPDLVGRLSRAFPEKAISTELKLPGELVQGLASRIYQMIILPFDPDNEPEKYDQADPGRKNKIDYKVRKIGEEHLMFMLPDDHPLAGRSTLSLKDMNGENMLLFSEIGFWGDIVRRKMPDSRFLVQNERYSFTELIENSVLPCFTTDLALREYSGKITENRTCIPITDEEVNVSYYLVCRWEDRRLYSAVFR
ncbi:MAG: LysR family transcriptional regulator [Anaerovoracaceae bacterium]|jgi:DNA-binding transcriptional LysR family regulator